MSPQLRRLLHDSQSHLQLLLPLTLQSVPEQGKVYLPSGLLCSSYQTRPMVGSNAPFRSQLKQHPLKRSLSWYPHPQSPGSLLQGVLTACNSCLSSLPLSLPYRWGVKISTDHIHTWVLFLSSLFLGTSLSSPEYSLAGLMLKPKLQYFGHLMWRTDSMENTLMLGKIEGRRRRGRQRMRDGWMASPTRWTWVWVSSGSWWWTGKPGVLQSIGLQRLGNDWVNWTLQLTVGLNLKQFCPFGA